VEGNPEGKKPILGHLGIDRMTMLQLVVQYNRDSNSSSLDPVAGSYVDSSELSGSIKRQQIFC
jgi:hypothetical protein